MGEIDKIHTDMPYAGQRKILETLKKNGYQIGRKLVRSLMREMGIITIYPTPNLSKCTRRDQIVPYLLRNANIFAVNQAWSIDITYIKLHRTHMYLTAIIDWHSRMIVGWKLSDVLDTYPVIDAVREATERYGTPAIINSDQGTQFTSREYKGLLKSMKIRQSMDGKSRWADNIKIERWFRSLKTEKLYTEEYETPKELRQAIKTYIDQYNNQRPHEALGYKTPAEVFGESFETAA